MAWTPEEEDLWQWRLSFARGTDGHTHYYTKTKKRQWWSLPEPACKCGWTLTDGRKVDAEYLRRVTELRAGRCP